MYQHQTTNRIIGWSLGGFALLIYVLTTAPVVAFWDNGEFVAVGYTLGVGHPPGSPVYTLLSRLFSLLPFSNVARAVNFMSVLAGALTIAFLYFVIAKMAKRWESKVDSFAKGLPTYVTGITACLFAAFSFSFWENALEAEVYATNILLMVGTLWLVLRWAELRDVPRDRRYLYLVAYLLALGVGVHMGCLLWAPGFLIFIILFERNFLGTVLLGLPLGLAFTLLSKGVVRGAVVLMLFWLVVTAFYAIPALWPKPQKPQRREKRKPKGTRTHPAMLPGWLWGGLLAIEVVFLFSIASTYGGGAAGWFLGCAAASALSVYLFVHFLRTGQIDCPEIPARMVLGVVVLGGLALSVHAYLLIRARLNPAINESDPHTWGLVLDVIRRKQYEPMRFFPRRTPFSNQLRILWGYYRIQFPVLPRTLISFASLPPFALAVWGAISHARKDRRTFWMMAMAFALASVALLFYMNISDHEVRTREYFWVPSYLGLALWMGIGCGSIVEWARTIGRLYKRTIACALVVFSLLPLALQYHCQDRSDNYVAYYYGWNMINFLEPNSILITNGDNDTFPLWYLQEVEGIRKDVEIVNLSLIQINWYIEQLKDRGIPMSFTYDEIERMHPYWVRDPETGDHKLITLKDIALHDIIRQVGQSRPIYFAVTVDDFLGYYDNLELQGMVFKLVPSVGQHQINAQVTYENVFENYRYDSLIDKDDGWRVMYEIYKSATTARLVTNYAAGFSRLGFKAMQQSPANVDEAIRLYDLALKFAPEYGPALNGLIAIYAARLYQPERALPLAERLIAAQPENQEVWVRYGGVNLMIAERLERQDKPNEATPHYEQAMAAYERVLRKNPERPEIYPALLSIYQRFALDDKLNSLIELWRQYAPEDFRAASEGAGRR